MLSVSSLSGYMYCPRKFYLSEVLKIFEAPKDVLVKGTIRHQVYDHINKNEESFIKAIKKDVNFGILVGNYKTAYSKILRNIIISNKGMIKQVNLSMEKIFRESWPLILAESEQRALNISSFIKKHNVFGEELWQMLTPKIMSEFRVESKTLMLKGIVDKVEDYADELVPYELKTGKCPNEGVWPGHKVQIGSYMLLLRESSKKSVKEGFIKYLGNNQLRQVTMNPFLEDEILKLRDEAFEVINSRTAPDFCENRNKCVKCGLREQCFSINALQKPKI
ncbi:MAG: CRISPR-associated protein Cas4 [Candidatus Woesearchaeota archaeon]|nr:CRISPR-associated protein Cas4 [Candidatus Woesearchaeota archaeon]